jgi:YidC/Oxa1 family membrane protein insertase
MNYSFLNLVTAIAVSILIIFGWQHFYEKPKLERLTEQQKHYNNQLEAVKKETKLTIVNQIIERPAALSSSKRVAIKSNLLSGSISLEGLRFDDLTLLKYQENLEDDKHPVVLFSPSSTKDAYFAEIGWWGSNKNISFPNSSTIWQADGDNYITWSTSYLYMD